MQDNILLNYQCMIADIDHEQFTNIVRNSKGIIEFLNNIKNGLLNNKFQDEDTYHVMLIMLVSTGKLKDVQQIAEAKMKRFSSLEAELLMINKYVKNNSISFGEWEKKFDMIINDLESRNKIRSLIIVYLSLLNGLSAIWGQFKKALEIVPKVEKYIEKLIQDCKYAQIYKGVAYGLAAWIYYQLGDLNKASDYLSKAYEIIEKTEDPIEVIRILHLRHLILGDIGNVKESIKNGHALLNLQENIGNYRDMSATLNNLAMQYWSLGDLKKAESLLEKAIEVFEKDVGRTPVLPLLNLTTIYIAHEKYDKAYETAMKAYKLLKEENITHPGIPASMARALIYMGKYDEAEKYLETLKKLAEKQDAERDLSEYYYLKGLSSLKQMDLRTAEKSFLKCLELIEPLNVLSEIVEVHIRLAEISLHRYKLTNNEEYLQKARKHLMYAKKECIEQGLEQQLIQIIQMEAILDKLGGMHEHAEHILKDAIQKFSAEHQKKLKETLRNIREAKSNKDRVGLFETFFKHTRNILKYAITRKHKKIDYRVMGYIVMTRTSGISIASKMYDEKLTADSDLVAGVISAVSNFITEISKDEGMLRSIVHENISILLDYDDNFIYALLTDKDTYNARRLLEKIKNTFKENYNIDMKKWNGNLEIFKNANAIISKVIDIRK